MIRAKKHRLPPAAYIGPKTVATTANTEGRIPFLRDSAIVEEFIRLLGENACRNQCVVPIYCFMPDHLHVLIQGTAERSRPKAAMDDFKTSSGLWLGTNRPALAWQDEYYDHLIRKSDDWRKQAFYILNNPVRKGLVTDPYDWPFTGSIGFDLREMFMDLSW